MVKRLLEQADHMGIIFRIKQRGAFAAEFHQRGFGFEVQLSLTKKGQYAVAYCLS